ncbi:TPA: NAD(P)H-dependent flavin oxidoreductase [Pseudomonas aeruginosa]
MRTNQVDRSWISELSVPVVCAPMFLVSGPELVLAACRSGLVGAFPAPNTRSLEQLDAWMSQIGTEVQAMHDKGLKPGPWAVNLITHSSNDRLGADLELVAKHRPPVVITALGGPRPVIDVVKAYGGLVIADVTSIRLARKAAEAGADGLACIAAGAGGHTGHLSPFAFVSAVREFFDGLLIIGGGISDGAAVAGAVAAGADLVYMGTRFLATQESMAAEPYKQMVVDCSIEDLVVSAGITGTPASWLRPSLLACGLDPDNLAPPSARNYDASANDHVKRWKDTWAAGQGLGTVRAIQSVSEVVAELRQTYRAAATRFCRGNIIAD